MINVGWVMSIRLITCTILNYQPLPHPLPCKERGVTFPAILPFPSRGVRFPAILPLPCEEKEVRFHTPPSLVGKGAGGLGFSARK